MANVDDNTACNYKKMITFRFVYAFSGIYHDQNLVSVEILMHVIDNDRILNACLNASGGYDRPRWASLANGAETSVRTGVDIQFIVTSLFAS